MRISEKQILQIHESIKKILGNTDYQLFLYGSRVHDHLKGGDIDLLIVTNPDGLKIFKDFYLALIIDLKKKSEIGDRRIDLKAATQSDFNTDPFLKTIEPELVKL